MSNRRLPDGAYVALEGLQGQAAAAMVLPDQDKAEAREALKAAQAKMAQNEEWTRKIVKALTAGDGATTVETADATWLERTFAVTADW
ncbi:hypothetical protein NPJ88_000135 [Halomonas elongata]|uniref:hypothetical protein n=1 Tax=Halomonas elongata TaxID=2746 RepID=UPI00255AAB0A|nr:hypothetical protein [Halomonas elongata]MDL4860730.1 hypothetical protein [Halomonas elongata]